MLLITNLTDYDELDLLQSGCSRCQRSLSYQPDVSHGVQKVQIAIMAICIIIFIIIIIPVITMLLLLKSLIQGQLRYQQQQRRDRFRNRSHRIRPLIDFGKEMQ